MIREVKPGEPVKITTYLEKNKIGQETSIPATVISLVTSGLYSPMYWRYELLETSIQWGKTVRYALGYQLT
jgi:hypothetical protein